MAANDCNAILTTVWISCSQESLCKLPKPSFSKQKSTQLNVRDCNKVILVEARGVIHHVTRLTPMSHIWVWHCAGPMQARDRNMTFQGDFKEMLWPAVRRLKEQHTKFTSFLIRESWNGLDWKGHPVPAPLPWGGIDLLLWVRIDVRQSRACPVRLILQLWQRNLKMLSALSNFLGTWEPFMSILSSPGSNKHPQMCVLMQKPS